MLLQCPTCAKQLKVPDTAAGKRVKCPQCATVLQIPALEAVAAAPAAPPPQAAPRRSAPPPPPAAADDGFAELEAAPAPRVRASRDDSRRDDDDYDDAPPAPRRRASRLPAALEGALLWLFIAICVLGGYIFVDLIETYLKVAAVASAFNVGGFRMVAGPSAIGSMLVWFFVYLIVMGPCLTFMFIGYLKGKSATGRGWVLAGMIISIVLGGLLAIVFILKLLGVLILITFFQIIGLLACGAAAGISLFAGIRGCIALGKPEVMEAFGLDPSGRPLLE